MFTKLLNFDENISSELYKYTICMIIIIIPTLVASAYIVVLKLCKINMTQI